MTLILRMFADFFIFIRLDQPNPQNPRFYSRQTIQDKPL